jgi:hypothetical protein
VIAGVSRIGIDFRAADKLKPGFFGQRDNEILTHIAGRGQRVLRLGNVEPVFLNSENATGFQNSIKIGERLFSPALSHPVVHIAKGQNCINRVRRRHRRRPRSKPPDNHRLRRLGKPAFKRIDHPHDRRTG